MKRSLLSLVMLCMASQIGWAQEGDQQEASSEPAEHQEIRERLHQYLDAFNGHDAAAVGAFWTADGVSVAAETGERTAGRDELQKEFATFFEENSEARLIGEVMNVRMIRPDVALIEGRTTLFTNNADPVESSFTAVLTKQEDQWLISSSHEHDIPSPATSHDALKELEWLVGTWEDQTDASRITTTVRWSPSQAFLIRSFHSQPEEGEPVQGTQVIGWDPLNGQFRTWTFNSDGSFGEGTASKSGDDWLLRLSQVLSDGRVASATQVITRVDDDTITVQTIGKTIDGDPAPASEPITVIRTGDAEAVTSAETSAN